MKGKIKLLILGCIAIAISLLLTQVYFIYNTYQLYKRQTYSEIRDELGRLERAINTDSIRYAWMDELKKDAAVMSFAEIEKKLQSPFSSTLSQKVNQYILNSAILKNHNVQYFNFISTATVALENAVPFTKKNLLWYGSDSRTNKVDFLNTYTLSSGAISSPHGNIIAELNTQSGFIVNNLNASILPKLTGILLFSFFLIIAVVYMFYVSIKNILREKKIADVKTDFVNNITHEFNTPLAALNVSVGVLKTKSEILNNPFSNDAVLTIERQYGRLRDLVNHATQYSLGKADILLNTTTVNSEQFLMDAVSDFARTHPEITVSYTPSKETIRLLIDPFHFTTAITNILDNAAKYGNNSVEVKSAIENNIYKISVTDNGAGIPKKKQHIIFDKFSRLERGNIHTVKGLGLGLYYTKQIVEAHNGTVIVASEAGTRTTFIISIPMI